MRVNVDMIHCGNRWAGFSRSDSTPIGLLWGGLN